MKSDHPVFIAEGNEALLDGLAAIISQEPGYRVAGTASTGHDLVHKASICTPEVFLLDIDLPLFNALQESKAIMSINSSLKVVILSNDCENSLVKRLLACGIKGCLRKTCDANELFFALKQVIGGKAYFSGIKTGDSS